MWKRVALLALIFAVLGPIPGTDRQLAPRDNSQVISARAVVLNRMNLDDRQVGELRFDEGWQLDSANTDFGSFSAMALLAPRHFLLLGDNGRVAGFTLSPQGDIIRPLIAPLPMPSGAVYRRKSQQDTESLIRDPASGRFWIGFEHIHAIKRYDAHLAHLAAQYRPVTMREWPKNGGAEAMLRLSDGRFIVFSEKQRSQDDGSDALIFAGDPTDPTQQPQRFYYAINDGWRVVDAAPLQDGRVLLLHRRVSLFDGFETQIAVADPAQIAPGRGWQSRVIATLSRPQITENFEGIAVEARTDGRIFLWIVSDDNLARWQRSLLLRFEWMQPATAPNHPAR